MSVLPYTIKFELAKKISRETNANGRNEVPLLWKPILVHMQIMISSMRVLSDTLLTAALLRLKERRVYCFSFEIQDLKIDDGFGWHRISYSISSKICGRRRSI